MDPSAVWSGQDPTLSGPDDFHQFLDMNLEDNLQFDFQDFQQPQDAQMIQDHGDRMDIGMGNVQKVMSHDTSMHEPIPPVTSTSNYASKPVHRHPNDSLVDLDAQIQFLQQQRHQQQQRQIQEQQRNYYTQQRMIPPTPNSVELHGAASQYYRRSNSQQHAMFEPYQVPGKERDMAFTPLVSPAVTPLEAHFGIPEYTIPGAYFSPLSSPALHAQSEHSSVYDQRLSGTTNSPVDMNLDSHSAPPSSVILSKKPSGKAAPSKTRGSRSVRQSPIVKPKRGKKNSMTALPPQILGDIMEPASFPLDHIPRGSSSHSAPSTGESESDSISPEHLSEMAPPPLPLAGSANRSPYVQAHKDNITNQRLSLGSPATPASLMRLAQSPHGTPPALSLNSMDVDEAMDGFALPEPATETATSRPQISRIETNSDGQTTPTLGSIGGKPTFSVMPSPSTTRQKTSISDSQSPQIESMNGTNGKKTPLISARGPKKRTSSSVLASPALLPKISPSIKPLLPGGTKITDDTASLLLASKSNYQKILEGTHLPGVSYPTELSTNLTSKRTSHKIAEQGRRNRINSALQEIATLLPKPPSKDSGGDGGENGESTNGKGSSQSANSKASTVELAIEYIKQLKKDLEEANKRAEKAEKELGKAKN